MIRVNDHVRTPFEVHGSDIAQVESVGEDGCLRVRFDVSGSSYRRTLDDGEATLLCGELVCSEPAAAFTQGGRPLCADCSIQESKPLLDVRPAQPPALVVCVCGESLDAGKSEGIWTMAEIACEYRTCAHCGSTRAYMPRHEIPNREVELYESPGDTMPRNRWDNLLDALDAPASELAELRRGNVVLARAFCFGVTYGWRVCPPEKET